MFFSKFFIDNFFSIFAFVTVSGKPPLFVIITAQPLAEASRLVLPKGSSHLEHATAILSLFKYINYLIMFLKSQNISIFMR